MKLLNSSTAGTLESSDIMISVAPGTKPGIQIALTSPVLKPYGASIRRTITDTLLELGVDSAVVDARDSGALDCIVRARTICAACRAAGEDYPFAEARRQQ